MFGSSLSTVFLTCIALFVGKAFCDLNVTIPFPSGDANVTIHQFLTVSDSSLQSNCQVPCQQANATINACTVDSCFCDPDTVSQVTQCEQCYFEQLIKEFRPIPEGDPRAGGQTALTAYGKACTSLRANITTAETALHVPTGWNGEFEQLLDTGSTVVVVAAALTLGLGCIGTLIVM